jgi:hypothetical protein
MYARPFVLTKEFDERAVRDDELGRMDSKKVRRIDVKIALFI